MTPVRHRRTHPVPDQNHPHLVVQPTGQPTQKVTAAGWTGLLATLVLAVGDQLKDVTPTAWWQAGLLGGLMWITAYLKKEGNPDV